MTYKLDEATWIATNDQWDTFNESTWVLTLSNWKDIQTEPISEAAQQWAEEYMDILEN